MKKFNLEEALAGKPVVTRDGRKVKELHLFKTDCEYPLAGVLEHDNDVLMFTKEGVFPKYFRENHFDLFMAEKDFCGFIDGNECYKLHSNGSICRDIYDINDKLTNTKIQQGNVFKTKLEAEKEVSYRAAKFRLNTKMRELDRGWVADWDDISQYKFYFYFNHKNKNIQSSWSEHQFVQSWRFAKGETINWVINNMQDDIKTILGVE